MRYSLLAPGKRIRPLLALAAAETIAPVGRRRAARVRGGRAGALLLADSRRSARDGRRRLPPRSSQQPQGVRRGDRDPRRRRAADAGVRLDRGGGRARRAAAALPGGVARARASGGRVRHGARPGPRSRRAAARRRWRRWRPCTRRRPARCSAPRCRSAAARPARGPTCSLDLARFGTAYGIAFQHADDIADAEHAEHAAAARDRLAALIADAMRRDRAARLARRPPGRAGARTRASFNVSRRCCPARRAVVIAWRLHASGRADPLVRGA